MRRLNIYDILFWVFFILAIIMGLWYLFGDSPTLEQALLVLIIGLLFKMQSQIISNSKDVDILKLKFGKIEHSFIKIADDFKSMKRVKK